jgi:hypothetical protein
MCFARGVNGKVDCFSLFIELFFRVWFNMVGATKERQLFRPTISGNTENQEAIPNSSS